MQEENDVIVNSSAFETNNISIEKEVTLNLKRNLRNGKKAKIEDKHMGTIEQLDLLDKNELEQFFL